MKPIGEVASSIGIDPSVLEPYGRHKAKLPLRAFATRPRTGRLVLVSAITPTPAGEGKTTMTVGLAQGLARIGVRSAAALREPSLGPVFGMKGGGAGGGRAEVLPMMDINLHFNGDFHAVSSAHNLLAALVDNALHFGARGTPRPAAGQLEARDRHERSRTARHRRRPRRPDRGRAARERFRHHRGQRGHGDPLSRERRRGPQDAARPHRRRIFRAGHAGQRKRDRRHRGHGGVARPGAQAQPRADHRGCAGVRPRRAFRQHRARRQQHPGDARRAVVRRRGL